MPRNNQNQQAKAGFTIIEVVLVLAIAGLIFLMVFVALPALQRSQRDTQRRNDMSRVDTSLVQYQTNHSNQSPNLPSAGAWEGKSGFGGWKEKVDGKETEFNCASSTACEFIRDYMNTGSSENDGKSNNFEDPNGVPYSMVITQNWATISQLPGDYSSLGESKIDVNSEGYYTIQDNGGNSFDAHVIYVIPGGRCVGDAATNSNSKNHFAILYRLEGAGTYCIDDQ